jgi:hypothetical protein
MYESTTAGLKLSRNIMVYMIVRCIHVDGFIPMHRACWGDEQRHTDTVRVFLEAGA